jgi:hypothetical protein
MIVALGGFPGHRDDRRLPARVGAALDVDLGILGNVLAGASAASLFTSWVDFICTNIPSSPCG